MRKLLVLIFFVCSLYTNAQQILGAWETTIRNNEGTNIKTIAIFTEGFYVFTNFKASDGEFISTSGGSWSMENNQLKCLIEFHYLHPKDVGTSFSEDLRVSENTLQFSHETFTRIDNGRPGALQGAWLMSGRKRNGELQSRDTSRPRKNMKILSGTRFQWIAYNTETKQFMATGGGTYTTIDGKYTENIEFFSRDASRVGMELQFDYNLVDGNWHHSGKSSKGNPIYEIWSQRN